MAINMGGTNLFDSLSSLGELSVNHTRNFSELAHERRETECRFGVICVYNLCLFHKHRHPSR